MTFLRAWVREREGCGAEADIGEWEKVESYSGKGRLLRTVPPRVWLGD